MRAASVVLLVVMAACGSTTDAGEPGPTTTDAVTTPSTAPADPVTDTTCSTVSDDACGLEDDLLSDPTGTATVTINGTAFDFAATRCRVADDVFVIDGISADGATTLAIRHASPPTRAEPQPSMSYLLIEPEPAFESAPASVTFDTYDPAAGIATGSVNESTSFSVRCER